MSKSKVFFGTSAIVNEVENATSEKNVEENWGVIITICDKAGKSSEDAKNYLKAILRRLANQDPHIGVKAVTLLDACIKNSGKTFHIEVASREFEQEFTRIVEKSPSSPVARKLRESLKKWAENEFKSDTQLSLIPSLYGKLKSAGHDFSFTSEPPKRQTPMSKDPNVVESQEEEEQILKAIELSLKETSGSPRANSTSTSLYPSMNMAAAPTVAASSAPAGAAKEPRKVRALYDFEVAEDNELTFSTGEIICVIDDSDQNWWKGSNQRGEGLFPANFVTADLSVEPEQFLIDKAKTKVQFKDEARADIKEPEIVTEINEEKIDRLLHLLHEADPTNPEHDTEEMLKLEGEVNGMGPLIDNELERVDRKHAQLTQLSADLVEALNLYHTLMREPQFPPVNKMPYGYQPPTSMPYGGYPPPPMGIPGQGGPPPPMGHHPQNMPPPHQHPQHPSQQQPPQPVHEPGRGVPFMQPPQGPMGPPPGHFHPGMMPPQGGGMPPMPMPAPGQDDRRFHTMPSYGSHPHVGPPPNFPQSASQNSMSGGPQQTLPYVPSSTHIMH